MGQSAKHTDMRDGWTHTHSDRKEIVRKFLRECIEIAKKVSVLQRQEQKNKGEEGNTKRIKFVERCFWLEKKSNTRKGEQI